MYPARVLGSKQLVIGADENATGALAGPFYVTAVCGFENMQQLAKDSKKFGRDIRRLAHVIQGSKCLAYSTVMVAPIDILKLGGHLAALKRAYMLSIASVRYKMRPRYPRAVIDGEQYYHDRFCTTMVQADKHVPAVSLASCLGKYQQLRMMGKAHATWPYYGFIRSSGYGTPEHLDAIEKFGALPGFHRLTVLAKMPRFQGRLRINKSAPPPPDDLYDP